MKFNISKDYTNVLAQLISDYDDTSTLWKYNLIKNKVLLTSSSNSRLIYKWYDGEIYLNNELKWNVYYSNNILISNNRSQIITKVLANDESFKLAHSWYKISDPSTDVLFYKGYEIVLQKAINNYTFRLTFEPQKLIVGFHEDDAKGFISIEKNTETSINKWLLARTYSPYPKKEEDFQDWIENVLNGIQELEILGTPILLDVKSDILENAI